MSDPLDEPDDGTPLTDEERQGLLLPVLTRKASDSGIWGIQQPAIPRTPTVGHSRRR